MNPQPLTFTFAVSKPASLAMSLGAWIALLTLVAMGATAASAQSNDQGKPMLQNASLQAVMNPATGCVTSLSLTGSANAMNWVHDGAAWGSGWILVNGQRSDWVLDNFSDQGDEAKSDFSAGPLSVTVSRSFDAAQRLVESYSFHNSGSSPFEVPEDGIGIRAPFNDSYAGGAAVCLSGRCNAHIWCGGSTAYICARPMSGTGPGLALVLTQGSITGYSVEQTTNSDDRGLIVLHPRPMVIYPGETRSISWVIFPEQDWNDFFQKAAALPSFVRLQASDYSLQLGQAITVSGGFSGARNPVLLADDASLRAKVRSNVISAIYRPRTMGEHVMSFEEIPALSSLVEGHYSPVTYETILRVFVTPPPADLVAARVKFIVEHQQRNAPGTALDGAYLVYDNDTGQQIYGAGWSDHNAGRERVGMGCLIARYVLVCKEPALKAELRASVDKYYTYVNRELTDDQGVVYGDVGRQSTYRIYNYAWVAELHVLMYEVTRDPECLHRFVRIIHALYAHGGAQNYCIGLPIVEGLNDLKKAGMTTDYTDLLALFLKHADWIAANGQYVKSQEVSYEQSIVAPAAEIEAEAYLVSGQQKYLDNAQQLMPLLLSFDGKQPDYRLNDISIRHWDDYWFGKSKQYGDTFPHYWTTITAVVLHDLAVAENKPALQDEAYRIVAANLCSFTADGHATCAHLYPDTLDGNPGRHDDAWANDQDWALDNYLRVTSPMPK